MIACSRVTCGTCFYCDGMITRHEHDHAPSPRRCGGVETVVACMTCHAMKDRHAIDRWPLALLVLAGVDRSINPHLRTCTNCAMLSATPHPNRCSAASKGNLMTHPSTVKVRPEWADLIKAECGGLASVSTRLGVDKSTVSRQFSGKHDAGPRFIAAVLTSFPVKFEDAFDISDAA